MYLKSIEVQGFKSFANKIKFDFHNGITAIVGPNGSGKSNVADAVRWVLGEQKVRQLRSGTMQDVIFSGTENRRPLSFAYVAITMDNSDHALPVDFAEVTVARRLYRSGESEYLLNGAACRLKDIQEMFYDTGIGKEGYSIIGQGQIDKILSGKPEERRELFDEAAGIVKYKRRKSVSLKKLDEEESDLTRVNDILLELEKQIGPLEEQDKTARAYLKKKEQLKVYDINLFLLEHDRLDRQCVQVDEKLDTASQQMQELSDRYEAMKAEYQEIEEKMDELDLAVETAKEQKSKTELLKQQLQGRVNVLKEQIRAVRLSDEHYEKRLTEMQSELDERTESAEKLTADKEELSEKLLAAAEADKQAAVKLSAVQEKAAEYALEAEKRKSEIMEILGNRASTSAKIQFYATTREQAAARQESLKEELEEAGRRAGEEQETLRQYEEELNKVRGVIAGYQQTVKKNEDGLHRLQLQMNRTQEELKKAQTAYHRESSRLEALKNLTERYDGYGNSIRQVMAQKTKEPGLIGLVADLIRTDKKYETAVETALGGSIRNIVTDNEETAKRMIAFLKRNKYGRATFLPLSALHGGRSLSRPEALREPGVIGTADDLVSVEEKYRVLAENLLAKTLVVDNIDHAIAISRKYRQSLRMVTLEGELLSPGGSMTGGAFKNAGNLLGRRREIDELETAVLKLKKEMDAAEREAAQIKETRGRLFAENDAIQLKIREASVLENTAQMNLEQTKQQIEKLVKQQESGKAEQKKLDKELSQIGENEESIRMELETSQQIEEQMNREIEHFGALLEEERQKESSLSARAEEERLNLAALQQQQDFLAENLTRVEGEIQKYREEMESLTMDRGGAAGEIREKEETIRELTETIAGTADIFAEIDAEIAGKTKERGELSQKHRDFLEKRESVSKDIAALDKEILRLNHQKEGYEESAEKLINYMWEEYELTYHHALERKDERLTDLSRMKKQIQTLKSDIRALGTVNVNAIEEYKNVSERYTFMKGQQEDLVKARDALLKIVGDLDTAMRRQFAEQFSRINEEFNTVFGQLFGGGKGTLELTEGDDILDAGIRIIAQPPGKKLQNMMQLSGGEKALTAIALLFAIQNLKPSPFCLLDEIEAALDDNNVVRFARYLRRLSGSTQFIVITHRRGTMAGADRLYGITMQEKGVSTLVSVDLLEDKLE